MKSNLPVTDESKALSFSHFPAPYQCVIFRNWGLVPLNRIAKVINTDEATLKLCAVALGLPEDPYVCPDWQTKGYITIIHYNWHLLSYENICILLDWPLEKLAFTLREDDFLGIKLGDFKPAVPDCRYRPLNDEEKARTAAIQKIVKETREKLPPLSAAPFDFAPSFRLPAADPIKDIQSRYEEKFLYSYCALYGDVLSDRALLDSSFPDALLSSYKAAGITGIWIHIVLYTVVPYPFAPSLSEGWEKRQEGMRILTEKLNKYGLRLFLYFNEPRAMPDSFFAGYPQLKGTTQDGYSALCISLPKVQDYLRQSCALLARNVPLLGGFFTITASENLTNCYSHVPYGKKTSCKRCEALGHAGSFALVNRLVWEGVSSVSNTVKVIAWTWGWDPAYAKEVIQMLPKEVIVMNVSEQDVHKQIGTTTTSVLDYSISVEGPGEYALENWRYAHQTGHKAYAKLQLNNSWEIAAVPFLPVFEKIYRHLKRLSHAGEGQPDGLMVSWTLGGYPSLTLHLLSACCDQKELPELSQIYRELFGNTEIDTLAEAFHQFSEAFDAYPFHLGCAYSGPQEHAPANLLYPVKTGLQATMTGFPYDDLDSWRSIFPLETYIDQLEKLSAGWRRGLVLLSRICSESSSPVLKEVWDCAEVCDCHFRSMYLQCLYICLRDGLWDALQDRLPGESPLTMEDILQEEETISLRVASVQAHNPTIGYESSNHYFYYRNVLMEKIVSCRYLQEYFSTSASRS